MDVMAQMLGGYLIDSHFIPSLRRLTTADWPTTAVGVAADSGLTILHASVLGHFHFRRCTNVVPSRRTRHLHRQPHRRKPH